jgi:cell division protein FtsB
VNHQGGNAEAQWDRVRRALQRLEKAGAGGALRRTAAEPEAGAESSELVALRDENESLRSEIADLRREAARMAQAVDRAMQQIDLIEKG